MSGQAVAAVRADEGDLGVGGEGDRGAETGRGVLVGRQGGFLVPAARETAIATHDPDSYPSRPPSTCM